MESWIETNLRVFESLGDIESVLDQYELFPERDFYIFVGAVLEGIFARREYDGSRYYAVLALQRLLNAPTEELDAFLGEGVSCQNCYGEGVCGLPEGHCE